MLIFSFICELLIALFFIFNPIKAFSLELERCYTRVHINEIGDNSQSKFRITSLQPAHGQLMSQMASIGDPKSAPFSLQIKAGNTLLASYPFDTHRLFIGETDKERGDLILEPDVEFSMLIPYFSKMTLAQIIDRSGAILTMRPISAINLLCKDTCIAKGGATGRFGYNICCSGSRAIRKSFSEFYCQ